MKKDNLVIFMPSIEGGGVEKNLFIIANYLSSKIDGIKLITTSTEFSYKFRNIHTVKPWLNFFKLNNRKIKYFICLIELLRMMISGKKFTVFSFQANLYCIIICKIFNKKIIIRSNSSPSGWSKNFIKKKIFKFLLKSADKIIVNSYDFKKQFKSMFNLKVKCIYNPLNKNEIIKLSKQNVYFPFFKKNNKILKIITIGRFTDQKDHMTLLKAVNLIKNKINFRLLIIGRGINESLMKSYIINEKLNKNIKILNFQKNPFKYLKLADVFILTSKFEGLPNVLLEATALKKFIISSNCPTGPKEILLNGDGGSLFKVGNYKELSKKIIEFKKKKNKMKKKINLNYNNLYRFNYDNNLKKYLTEINNIIK